MSINLKELNKRIRNNFSSGFRGFKVGEYVRIIFNDSLYEYSYDVINGNTCIVEGILEDWFCEDDADYGKYKDYLFKNEDFIIENIGDNNDRVYVTKIDNYWARIQLKFIKPQIVIGDGETSYEAQGTLYLMADSDTDMSTLSEAVDNSYGILVDDLIKKLYKNYDLLPEEIKELL